MSAETIAREFKMLSRAYPDYAAKYLQGEEAVQTMRLYQRALEDMPDEVLEAAALDHIARSSWWPKVNELRERCVALMANEAELPDPYEAWAMVCEYLRRRTTLFHRGQFRRPQPPPEIIERAVRGLGGWEALAMSEDTISDRARFIDAYERLVRRERTRLAELPAVREARRLLAEQEKKQLEGGNGANV